MTLVPGGSCRRSSSDTRGQRLDIINGQVLDLPNGAAQAAGSEPDVFRIHYDRPDRKDNYRTSVTVGAATVQRIAGLHRRRHRRRGHRLRHHGLARRPDGRRSTIYPYGNQRVTKFVDFVNGRTPAVRRQRPRHARRRHHRRQRLRLERRQEAGIAPEARRSSR